MPDKKEFALGDYIEVKDRIVRFYELFGAGRLVTEEVKATSEPDGKPRIWVKAAAYRTADDPKPGIGWSWLELPGATPYTRGSELENAETSAWGRAIGSLGILIDRSIASGNEVRSKAEPAKPAPRAPQPRSATPAANEPPPMDNDALDALVASQTAILRPPQTEQAQAAERATVKRAERVAADPGALTFGELHPCKLHAVPMIQNPQGSWYCPQCKPPR
jgi:hypothetical protein